MVHVASTLTLDVASTIADAALAEGRRRGFNPLTVVVLDSGGHLVVVKREDGSGILRFAVAQGKAYGALGLGVSGPGLRDLAVERPFFTDTVATASAGRFVPVPGGVLIMNADGHAVGAVGISGDTSDADQACAIAGVRATSLTPDPDV